MNFSVDTVVNRVICEDIDSLSMPVATRKVKNPCSICFGPVMKNQKGVECDSCKLYAHIKCDGSVSAAEYEINTIKYGCASESPWYCLVCRIRHNHVLCPITVIDNQYLININNSNSVEMFDVLPTSYFLSKYAKLKSHKIDSKLPNKELKGLHQWLSVNRLALNITKTNFVIFHPYNRPLSESITLKINKKAISEKTHIKYLGVLIDSTLCWKPHTDNLSKKIARAMGIMYKVRPFVNSLIMLNLYYSLVYPHLLYGIEVWGSSFEYNLNRIYMLQKKIVRMMSYNDNKFEYHGPLAHTSPIFKKMVILKVTDVFQ